MTNHMHLQDFVCDDKIASLPGIFYELTDVIGNPDSALEDIQNLISMDPALTARLLSIVNNPPYRFNTKINSVAKAVSIIELRKLKELVFSSVVIEQFKEIPDWIIDMDKFWRHSMACGLGAKIIAGRNGESDTESYFVAGLLHDIGHLVLCMKVPEKIRDVFQKSRIRNRPVHELELEEFGFTHAEVGAHLLKLWKLSPCLQRTVLHHHNFMAARQEGFRAATVHVADSIANTFISGTYEDSYYCDPRTLNFTGLGDKKTHDQVTKEIHALFDRTVQGIAQTA